MARHIQRTPAGEIMSTQFRADPFTWRRPQATEPVTRYLFDQTRLLVSPRLRVVRWRRVDHAGVQGDGPLASPYLDIERIAPHARAGHIDGRAMSRALASRQLHSLRHDPSPNAMHPESHGEATNGCDRPQAAAASSQVKCNHFGRSSRGAAFALGRIAARDLGVVMTTPYPGTWNRLGRGTSGSGCGAGLRGEMVWGSGSWGPVDEVVGRASGAALSSYTSGFGFVMATLLRAGFDNSRSGRQATAQDAVPVAERFARRHRRIALHDPACRGLHRGA